MNISNIGDKLDEIARVLLNSKTEKISLTGGRCGIALFHFYYGRYAQSEVHLDKGAELVLGSLKDLRKYPTSDSFASGISGILWTVNHLVRNDFVELDTADFLSDMEEKMLDSMMDSAKKNHYDFFYGALGVGFYFFSSPLFNSYQQKLEELLSVLEKNGQPALGGSLKWETILNAREMKVGCSLGLAHGMSVIVRFCSKYYLHYPENEKVEKLAERTINYILNQKLPEGHHSVFANHALESYSDNDGKDRNSRLAWCNGDLGIAYSLFMASKSFGRSDWKEESLNILLQSTYRKKLEKNKVYDAGLCHGTAGIAHIYRRMFLNTGMQEFEKASLYWYDQTLKMATHKDGLAGYMSLYSEDVWEKKEGLLEGIAGIGLSFVSVVSGEEPAWDEALLLSDY